MSDTTWGDSVVTPEPLGEITINITHDTYMQLRTIVQAALWHGVFETDEHPAARAFIDSTQRKFYERPAAEGCGPSWIEIRWTVGDVQTVRPDLTDEQALSVLYRARTDHEANTGITYDVLEQTANHLYPCPPALPEDEDDEEDQETDCDRLVAAARAIVSKHAPPDLKIDIDEDADISHAGDGDWVRAWVFVPHKEEN
jgi:hypothetical protein